MDIIVEIFKYIALTLLTIVLLCTPTMLLWNWLMPYLFGFPTITFWKAAGMLTLSYLLFNKYNA
jgi:membrane protein required for beta-lactamase induction